MRAFIVSILLSSIFLFCKKNTPAHSIPGAWQNLPSVVHGEMQGLPAHWSTTGKRGMVSTANSLASQAAVHILKNGGNAIDALLAAQWVLAVVEPQSSGLGGGGFLVYYEAQSKKVMALDAREETPEVMEENAFLDSSNKPLPFMERIRGARAVGVPGTVALMEYSQKRWGSRKISFAQTFERAIELAQNGIMVSPRLAQAIKINRDRLAQYAPSAKIFLKRSSPYETGDTLLQEDLAATFKLLARGGSDEFYRGSIADDIVHTVKHNGIQAGYLSASDLLNYRVVERKPVQIEINDITLFSHPAPASGLSVLQGLRLLSLLSAEVPQFENATFLTHLLNAQKLALSDREAYIEDPDFSGSNYERLLDDAYLKKRARSFVAIAPFLAGKPSNFSVPEKMAAASTNESPNTTHIVIADEAGNVVSYTSSIETGMGSALVVKNRGFLLNNQLSDFTPELHRVNAIENKRRERTTALNTEARATKGGKRPRSSMAPLLLFKRGKFFAALGTPGGPIIVGTLIYTTHAIMSGIDIQNAVNLPRAVIRNDGKALLEIPLRRNRSLVSQLTQTGFDIELKRPVLSIGSVQAISYDSSQDLFFGASDLRREGIALSVEPTLP